MALIIFLFLSSYFISFISLSPLVLILLLFRLSRLSPYLVLSSSSSSSLSINSISKSKGSFENRIARLKRDRSRGEERKTQTHKVAPKSSPNRTSQRIPRISFLIESQIKVSESLGKRRARRPVPSRFTAILQSWSSYANMRAAVRMKREFYSRLLHPPPPPALLKSEIRTESRI